MTIYVFFDLTIQSHTRIHDNAHNRIHDNRMYATVR